jgi:regulator of vacuolar morphogenesis
MNSSSAATGLHSAISGPSGPVTDPQLWLDVHRELKSQLHDARLHLQRRDQATTSKGQHESSAQAKKCLVKAGSMISNLEDGLKQLSESQQKESSNGGDWGRGGDNKIGEGELRRRRDLIASSRREKEGLEALANSLASKAAAIGALSGSGTASASAADSAALFSNPSGGRNFGGGGGKRVLGAPLPETKATRHLDNEGVLMQQQEVMRSQDMDVEQLRKIVERQKELGVAINEELVLQNELLGNLNEDVERVDGKMRVANKRVKKMNG